LPVHDRQARNFKFSMRVARNKGSKNLALKHWLPWLPNDVITKCKKMENAPPHDYYSELIMRISQLLRSFVKHFVIPYLNLTPFEARPFPKISIFEA